MTKYLVEGETLSDIADAIREQTGEAGQIQLKEFANKVASISGGKHTYSTTEQEVGEWIDGSTVYEKVIDLGTLPNNTTKNVAHGISNLGRVIQAELTADNGANWISIPYTTTNSTDLRYQLGFWITDTNIAIKSEWDRSAFGGYAILRYTKASASLLSMNSTERNENEETTSTEEKEGGEEK